MYQSRPVACKLADFGESRSLLIQTQTMLASKTNVDRGTLIYMAPELLLKELALSTASIDDLTLANIWALGMIFFTMINPSLKSPYILDIRPQRGISSQGELKSFITSLVRSERYPMQDAKCEIACTTCKEKLNSLGIRKKEDQKFFVEQFFANDENAILESEEKHQMETCLKTAWPLLDEEEKRLTAT